MTNAMRRALLASLAASALLILLFGLLTLYLPTLSGETGFDATTARSLRDYQVTAPALVSFFRVFTELGSKQFTFVVMGLVGVILTWRKQPLFAALLFIAFVGGCGLSELVKRLMQRPRPPFANLSTFSFPSGHSTGSLLCFGLLAYLVVIKVKNRGVALAISALLLFLALLVGYSRVFLTVHYPSDVVGSWLLSLSWLILAIPALEAIRRRTPAPQEEGRPSWELLSERRGGYQGSRPLY